MKIVMKAKKKNWKSKKKTSMEYLLKKRHLQEHKYGLRTKMTHLIRSWNQL